MVERRTQLMNRLRRQRAELGIVAAPGGRGFAEPSALVGAEAATIRRCSPGAARPALHALLGQIAGLQASSEALAAQMTAAAKTDPVMRRLTAVPGRGGLTAHAIVASGQPTAANRPDT